MKYKIHVDMLIVMCAHTGMLMHVCKNEMLQRALICETELRKIFISVNYNS